MNNTLYIIGNGFDIHHKMKTDYSFFREFLINEYSDLFEKMSSFYDVDEDSLLWSEFEKSLADFESSSLEDNFSEYMPNYSSDGFRERDRYDLEYYVRNELEPLRTDLQAAFNRWIENLESPTNFEAVKLNLDIDATYLNFNYTDLLESIYSISRKNITYIHNRINEKNDLLFGHGWIPGEWSKLREEKMPNGLSEEEQHEWMEQQADNYDYSVNRGYEAIDSFFSEIYKDCNKIINSQISFFKRISDVTTIYVLGHSLSDVDKPYFEKIVSNIDKAKVHWHISCFDSKKKNSFRAFVENLGINKDLIDVINLSDLQISNSQAKLV